MLPSRGSETSGVFRRSRLMAVATFSMGIHEHYIFTEIDYDKIDKVKGMNISIVTTAKTDAEARQLLKLMGVPFRN